MVNESKPEPRRPTDLPGLLRWSAQVADGTQPSTVREMDPERREWLRNAFNEMTVDEVEVMRKDLKVLTNEHTADSPEQLDADRLRALEELQMLVESLDNAADLQKIGGFPIVLSMLSNTNPALRAAAADVVATSVQSHPPCQSFALQAGTLSTLIPLLSDSDSLVRKKAMYAISAMIREYEPGEIAFLENGGLDVLKVAVTDDNPAVRVKALFLLRNLCVTQPDRRNAVREHGLLSTIVALVTDENSTVREQALLTLLMMVEDNPANLAVCRMEENGLRRNLVSFKRQAESSSPEALEELDDELRYANDLYRVCFESA